VSDRWIGLLERRRKLICYFDAISGCCVLEMYVCQIFCINREEEDYVRVFGSNSSDYSHVMVSGGANLREQEPLNQR
jgi:hypothetical protein